MSDNKPGRQRRDQNAPIIFAKLRSKVEVKVKMSAKTAATLRQYVSWAAEQAGEDEEEVMVLTLDQALTQLFQRDTLFQQELAAKPAPTQPAPAQPATPTPGNGTGLRPPASQTPRLPPPSTASPTSGTGGAL